LKNTLIIFFLLHILSHAAYSDSLRLGTASHGGPYYHLGESIQKHAGAEGIAIEVISTKGSTENIRLLQQGELDLAIVQNDIAFYAEHGRAPFHGTKYKNFRGVICLHQEPIYLITTINGTNNPRDFINKRVNVGLEQSGLYTDAQIILKTLGIDEDIIACHEPPENVLKSLQQDTIKLAFVNSISDSMHNQLAEKKLSFFPLTSAEINNLTKTYPCFTPYKTVYNKIPVSTVAVHALLITRKDMPQQTVYRLTGILNQFYDEQFPTEPAENRVAFMTLKNWHSGAEKYFQQHHLLPYHVFSGFIKALLIAIVLFHIIVLFSYYIYSPRSINGNGAIFPKFYAFSRTYTEKLVSSKNLLIILGLVFVFVVLVYAIHFIELNWAVNHNQTSRFGAKGIVEKMLWVLIYCGSGFHDNVYPKSELSRVLLTMIRLIGLGALFAFVGKLLYQEVLKKLQTEKGERVRKVKNHIVVCGYNQNVPNFLSYLADEHIANRRHIVLLAPLGTDKPWKKFNLDKQVIHYVNGSATKREDLQRAHLNQADIAVIVADEGCPDPDANNILKILTIEKYCTELESNGERGKKKNIYTIAEIENPENHQLARDACVDEIISLGEIKSKIFAQAVLTPGVSNFIEEILTFNDLNDLYPIAITQKCALQNKTFDEMLSILRRYNILLLSIRVAKENGDDPIFKSTRESCKLNGDAIVITNPFDDKKNYRAQTGDVLIVLATSGSKVKAAEAKLGFQNRGKMFSEK